MVKIEIEYTGDLHCQAVHGPSGSILPTDAPVDNQGKGEAFSPTDLIATSLGTCMATTMGIYAKNNGIDMTGTRVQVLKEMSKDLPRRIARLTTEIHIPLPKAQDPDGNLEKAAMGCPVYRSLHPDVEKLVTFYWKD